MYCINGCMVISNLVIPLVPYFIDAKKLYSRSVKQSALAEVWPINHKVCSILYYVVLLSNHSLSAD